MDNVSKAIILFIIIPLYSNGQTNTYITAECLNGAYISLFVNFNPVVKQRDHYIYRQY